MQYKQFAQSPWQGVHSTSWYMMVVVHVLHHEALEDRSDKQVRSPD